jgi:hypothetical protein
MVNIKRLTIPRSFRIRGPELSHTAGEKCKMEPSALEKFDSFLKSQAHTYNII